MKVSSRALPLAVVLLVCGSYCNAFSGPGWDLRKTKIPAFMLEDDYLEKLPVNERKKVTKDAAFIEGGRTYTDKLPVNERKEVTKDTDFIEGGPTYLGKLPVQPKSKSAQDDGEISDPIEGGSTYLNKLPSVERSAAEELSMEEYKQTSEPAFAQRETFVPETETTVEEYTPEPVTAQEPIMEEYAPEPVTVQEPIGEEYGQARAPAFAQEEYQTPVPVSELTEDFINTLSAEELRALLAEEEAMMTSSSSAREAPTEPVYFDSSGDDVLYGESAYASDMDVSTPAWDETETAAYESAPAPYDESNDPEELARIAELERQIAELEQLEGGMDDMNQY